MIHQRIFFETSLSSEPIRWAIGKKTLNFQHNIFSLSPSRYWDREIERERDREDKKIEKFLI